MRAIIGVVIFFGAMSFLKVYALPPQGFSLSDKMGEVTFRYEKQNELIILSPLINDSLKVNLILDTGFRNTVLFGRRFLRYFHLIEKPLVFYGLGEGDPAKGKLALSNKFTMNGIVGNNIAVIVVPKRGSFSELTDIDGVIGYDLLYRFEIEVNPKESKITFRSLENSKVSPCDLKMELDQAETCPITRAELIFNKSSVSLPLLIDTGSTLGLLYKTNLNKDCDKMSVGMGLNGVVRGDNDFCEKFIIDDRELEVNLPMIVAPSNVGNSASIGMAFLKNYSFVINLSRGYFTLTRA